MLAKEVMLGKACKEGKEGTKRTSGLEGSGKARAMVRILFSSSRKTPRRGVAGSNGISSLSFLI